MRCTLNHVLGTAFDHASLSLLTTFVGISLVHMTGLVLGLGIWLGLLYIMKM